MMTQDQGEATGQMPRDDPFDLAVDLVVPCPIPLPLKEPRGINATTSQLAHAGPESAAPRPFPPRRRGSASTERATLAEELGETAPLIGAPAFYGPPISFLLGPWLLLVLLLSGPFALIFTILVVLAAAAVALAVPAAAIATPFLLIRHLHRHDTVQARPRVRRRRFHKHHVGSSRLDSPQPKGVS